MLSDKCSGGKITIFPSEIVVEVEEESEMKRENSTSYNIKNAAYTSCISN